MPDPGHLCWMIALVLGVVCLVLYCRYAAKVDESDRNVLDIIERRTMARADEDNRTVPPPPKGDR